MKYVIVLIMLLTFFSGCTKFGKNVTIKGKIINPVTGQGIEGIELNLLREKATISGGFKSVKSTTTDANGDFEISKLGLNSYHLRAQTGVDLYDIGWFQNDENITGTGGMLNVKRGKTMHVEYRAVEYGNLQINIKNLSCFDTNDELKIFRTHSLPDFYNSVPNPAIYSGCIDNVGSLYQAPMGLYTYNGTVTKNGVVTPISDSIYLSAGQSFVWNIYY